MEAREVWKGEMERAEVLFLFHADDVAITVVCENPGVIVRVAN